MRILEAFENRFVVTLDQEIITLTCEYLKNYVDEIYVFDILQK